MTQKIYEPAFAPDPDHLEAYADFFAVVRQLRRDCPWDREQTHESVKHLLIEEAYEALDAIDRGDRAEMKQELGDLLLHVAFHSVIAEKEGTFTMKEVIETETEKLVRRHPHVFGETEVSGVAQVLQNWEQIKRDEGGRRSTLAGVPAHLPGLLRAYRIQEKAAGVGFDFPDAGGAWEKVEEELKEFREMVDGGASEADREAEFGDLLFAMVNYARFAGINPENALRRSNEKFARRFRHVEDRLEQQGRDFADADLAEMDRYWDEAKAREGGDVA
jgi:MazG family protein